MRTTLELVTRLEKLGAHLTLEGSRVKIRCPESVKEKAAPLLGRLRGQRQKLIPLVCGHGEYCRRLNRAKARIAEQPYYDGLVPWLKRENSNLYSNFYVQAPRRIDDLGKAGTPIQEFQALLDTWVRTYATAVELWEGHEAD